MADRRVTGDPNAGNRLTVVQLLPALDAGGVERGTLEIAAALVAAGHRSVVISAGGRMVRDLEAGGSEHITLPIGAKRPWTLLQVGKLRRLFRTLEADIVHARSRVPAWLTYFAWSRMPPATRPRFVTTVHGYYSVSRYSAIMTRGERVVAVSNAIRDYIHANYDVAPDRVVTIHRGIDRHVYPHAFEADPSWLQEWASPAPDVNTPLLTLAGRLTRLKGHETLIELMRRLKERGIAAHALVVGGEDAKRQAYAHEIYARAGELPVSFLGHRDDLRELMSRSAIVLSLSTQPESFGRTVLEALSLGRPVVGFDHGGVGEILNTLFADGAVAPGDLDTLTDKVQQFLMEPPSIADHTQFALADMQAETLSLYAGLARGEVG